MTRRALVTALATAALVGAGALSAAAPAAAAAPAPPYTAIAFRAPELAGMPWGGAFSASVPGDAVTVGVWGGDGVRGSSGERAVVVFPPAGATLAAGTSFPLQPTRTSGAGTVELTEPGHTCTYQWGTVTVQEVTHLEGALTVFSADVVGSCATASVRLAATTPWRGLSVVDHVEFPQTDLAMFAERDVVVGVEGDSAVLFGDSDVTALALDGGEQAEDFGVIDDGCSGTTVQPGSSCAVTVWFSPWAEGLREARLVIPDGTAVGSTEVRLAGFGTTDSSGTYVGVTPTRLLDTRTAGTKSPLAGGSTTRLQVAGAAGVPASGVSAVVVNLTAVTTTSQGYFTMYPNGVARPTASSINFPKGWTGANMVTVPVGADGKVALYNYGGPAHAVLDVLGWYWKDAEQPVGSQFLPIGDAFRLFDSRDEGGALRGGDVVDLAGVFGGPKDTADISEFVVTVTAVGATKPGVLTAWSGEGTRPGASTVNYQPGVIAPNMAVVTAGHGEDGAGLRISNTTSGSVHVVVDLVGIHVADSPFGLRFTPRAAPTRILDTRKGTGLTGAFGPAQTRTLNGSSVASDDTFALVANTTGVLPTRQTYLSVWAAEQDAVRPDASILNVNPGLVRSASTYAPVSGTGRTRLYNNAGSMHVVMDVAGTLDFYPSSSGAGIGMAAGGDGSADAWPGGRDLRPTVTVESVRARVTRG